MEEEKKVPASVKRNVTIQIQNRRRKNLLEELEQYKEELAKTNEEEHDRTRRLVTGYMDAFHTIERVSEFFYQEKDKEIRGLLEEIAKLASACTKDYEWAHMEDKKTEGYDD